MQKEIQNFMDKALELGKKKGFTAGEVFYKTDKSIEIQVYRGDIEKYDISQTGGLSYRGILDGKMGYSHTELISDDDSVVEELINNAYESAKATETEDEVFIFGEKCEYEDVHYYNESLAATPVEKKIELIKNFDKKVREMDERVMDVHYCTYSETETSIATANTYGIKLSDKRNYGGYYAMVSIKDGDQVRTNFDGDLIEDFSKVDIDKTAKKLVEDGLAQIGAAPIPSKNAKIVIDKGTFAQLLSVHMGMFSADSVQKGLSPLKGKIGEKIAVDALSIMDDPHREGFMDRTAFDGEGYPTSKKFLIENGVLKTYFHNLKTAKKDGVESTGNASRPGYKGSVGIMPHAVVIEGGSLDRDGLIKKCGEGILITELGGLHAGVNPISGDFSLIASGFEITGGKKGKPITQVVLSGNFYEMLKDIEEIGSDNECTVFSPSYFVPSVIIRQMTVSGE